MVLTFTALMASLEGAEGGKEYQVRSLGNEVAAFLFFSLLLLLFWFLFFSFSLVWFGVFLFGVLGVCLVFCSFVLVAFLFVWFLFFSFCFFVLDLCILCHSSLKSGKNS